MPNFIKKINFFHSLIFFFVSSLIIITLEHFKNLTISPAFCLLLILSIGISHGALDNFKGKKLIQLYNIKKSYTFYLIYILIVISVIILWSIFPTFSLIIFLIVASYHFGKEDTEFLNKKKSNFNLILYFLKGLLIIIAPIIFHFVETISIFKLLLIDNKNFYSFLTLIENNNILSLIFLISIFANIYFFINKFKFINFSIFFDFFSIVLLNYFLSPLIAFSIYFCFLHSFRHSISLIIDLDKSSFKNGFLLFLKKAIPLTIITAIFYLLSLYFLSSFYNLNDSILKVIFIGLASLTFPHILLEYFLEKNEK